MVSRYWRFGTRLSIFVASFGRGTACKVAPLPRVRSTETRSLTKPHGTIWIGSGAWFARRVAFCGLDLPNCPAKGTRMNWP